MSTDFVVIGLGSNLGQPLKNLRNALSEIKNISKVQVIEVSSIYESEAQVPESAPLSWNKKFLNAAILLEVTEKKPLELLQKLKKIEFKLGRQGAEIWAPRLIDLDILYWSGLKLNEPALKIPHPLLGERPFALLPLLQILPTAKVSYPAWAYDWATDKPFSTIKSKKYFWPQCMGIININEDSFSDNGKCPTEQSLSLQIEKLITEGAEVLDFGGESTRPEAKVVDTVTEWNRLKMALALIKNMKVKVQVSIDSYKPEVVEKCLEFFEIDFINDVTGLKNPRMRELAKHHNKKVFIMHSISVPPKQQETLSEDVNPIHFLQSWWQQKRKDLLNFGLLDSNLIFDPGIGFGKTKQQNQFILTHLQQMSLIKNDILIGHSRKSYQTLYSDRPAGERDLETALTTHQLNLGYVQFLRIHDMRSQIIALRSK